jgi:hypothetical protein
VPRPERDTSHGIANKTVNIQSLNSDGKTWSTIGTYSTLEGGGIALKLTPMAAGVYTYRMTYVGDSQYTPAVSNVVTLTVTSMVIS